MVNKEDLNGLLIRRLCAESELPQPNSNRQPNPIRRRLGRSTRWTLCVNAFRPDTLNTGSELIRYSERRPGRRQRVPRDLRPILADIANGIDAYGRRPAPDLVEAMTIHKLEWVEG